MTTRESMKAIKQRTMVVHILVFLLFCAAPMIAQAADIPTAAAKPINLSIGVGGVRQVSDLPQYLGVLYRWFVGAAMVIAAFMITLGGFQYVASAGIPKYVGMAKQRIINGLMGLLLVIGSYVLLNSINPAFTQLKLPDIRKIENIPLPSDICNNPSIESYECGKEYKGEEGKQPAGKSCIGMGKCGTGKCLDISGTGTEVSFGAPKKAPKFSCVNASKCAQASGNPSCEGITPELFGDAWKAYCNSGICNAAIGEKNGCFAIDEVLNGKLVQKCQKLGGPGQYCTVTPCGEGLMCNESVTPSVCVVKNSVADEERCKRDQECASKMCNHFVGTFSLSTGDGLCAPTGGYKTLTGDDRFADCNGGVATWSDAQVPVCGEGWTCVKSRGAFDSQCTDLATGSPCDPNGAHCAEANDECVKPTTALHFSCTPKPPSATTPPTTPTP